jgi:hypothetical protein
MDCGFHKNNIPVVVKSGHVAVQMPIRSGILQCPGTQGTHSMLAHGPQRSRVATIPYNKQSMKETRSLLALEEDESCGQGSDSSSSNESFSDDSDDSISVLGDDNSSSKKQAVSTFASVPSGKNRCTSFSFPRWALFFYSVRERGH